MTFESIVFFFVIFFFYRESSEFRNLYVRFPPVSVSGAVLEISTGYHVNVAGISKNCHGHLFSFTSNWEIRFSWGLSGLT